MQGTPGSRARTLGWLLTLGLVASTPLAWSETLYVLSDKAPLLESPSFTAPALTTLTRGETLALVREDGNWLQVEHADATAWVSRWLVGANPPQDKVSVLTDDQPGGEVRRRASSVTTAGAIRGLSEGEAELGGDAADYAELEYLESLRPAPQTLDAFRAALAEGDE